MTPAISNPPHARRAYDHRLRERVVVCGASAVAKHVQIPRSTVSTWRRRGLRPVVTTESVGPDLQNALDSSARWEERARLLAAVVRLLLALLRASSFNLRAVVEFHVNEHNTKMPHAAFSGQTPDEIFFGTGARVPEELALAKGNARAARMAANRAMSCELCLGQQAQTPEGALSP